MIYPEMLVLVRKAKLGGVGRKAVMMVLAEHCGVDADGNWSGYPGQMTIAGQVELTDRQVRSILAQLEDEGLIVRQHRGRSNGDRGGRTSDRVTLDLDAIERLHPLPTQPEETSGNSRPNRKLEPTQPEAHFQGSISLELKTSAEPLTNPRPESVIATAAPDGAAERTRKPRPPDPLFDAVVSVCGIETDKLTPTARGALNGKLKELRGVDATPEEVWARAPRFIHRFPSSPLTPAALAKWWPQLNDVAMGTTCR